MAVSTIRSWDSGQGIRIPKRILDAARINVDDQVEIDVSDGRIMIKKLSGRKSIRELFEGYEQNGGGAEIDWGEPKGDEVW